MLDNYSNYKVIVRNLIIRKHNIIFNSYNIPKISKIIYSFRMYKLEDLDDIQVYNYLYYFKFFFGRRGSLTKYKSFFNLGVWTYTYRVCMFVFEAREIYKNIYLLFSEYLIHIDKSYLTFGFYTKLAKIYYIIIKELNYFSERKTNIGLFHLRSNLLISLYLNGKFTYTNKMLPKNMKLILNK